VTKGDEEEKSMKQILSSGWFVVVLGVGLACGHTY
jgi:hypothetical protein